jgi:hypothetical protein
MPKRILVRVPIKATAKAAAAAATTIRQQADDIKGGECEAEEAKLDEFGLLTYNYTMKTTTAEKRMLQPTSTSEPPKKKNKSYKKHCSFEGCTRQEQHGGVCWTHGAKESLALTRAKRTRKKCKVEDCTKNAKKGGLCIAHGCPKKKKKCSYEGCTVNPLKNGVFCCKHVVKEICSVEGCSYQAQRFGECWRHAQESVLRKILSEEEQARCTTDDQNNRKEEERAGDETGAK